MRDCRRFLSHASAKRETVVVLLSRARANCETMVVFGAVQARNAGHWSLFDKCRREMRDCRRFLSHASAKRETVVVLLSRARAKCETIVVFGAVQARNAGHWSLFDKCRREMRDCRRFLSHASAKRETVVVLLSRARAKCETFVVFGVVQARIAAHWSLLDSCRREMRDCRRFLSRASAKTRDCRRSYESCARDMRDIRRFWSRAGAKCETLVVFAGIRPRSS